MSGDPFLTAASSPDSTFERGQRIQAGQLEADPTQRLGQHTGGWLQPGQLFFQQMGGYLGIGLGEERRGPGGSGSSRRGM